MARSMTFTFVQECNNHVISQMLIDGNTVAQCLKAHSITVHGALHIGAHECEERGFYLRSLGLSDETILWIDGNASLVDRMRERGFQNIYTAILDETVRECIFNITDNSQASSLLTLNHAAGFYRSIDIIEKRTGMTETLAGFFTSRNLDASRYNFWNLDIQGSELAVIRGSQELLKGCDAIYTEVNRAHVYTGCGLIGDLDALLAAHGFERVMTKWTDVQWGDALYIKKRAVQIGK